MSRQALYSIPTNLPFSEALAWGLRQRANFDPLLLSRNIVLMPNRRASRSLIDAFQKLDNGKPTILPQIQAVGDVEQEMFFESPATALDFMAGEPPPPAISPLRRHLLLTQLVMQYLNGMSVENNYKPDSTSQINHFKPDQASRLALELARFLDRMQTQGSDFKNFHRLVPDSYAMHWQGTLKFLQIVIEVWPQILKQEGAIDPVARRDWLLRKLAATWSITPPAYPITIAGSTGSVPATAELMSIIAELPNGAVVLPGLDRNIDEQTWDVIIEDISHPQNALARLLEKLNVSRNLVMDWPINKDIKRHSLKHKKRIAFLSEVMRPASMTGKWESLNSMKITQRDLEALNIIECDDLNAEASVIALLLRETLETAGKRAALITADRSLARRVKSEMLRWKIEIDDSAGIPLADTPALIFWRLTASMVIQKLAPVPLLSVLKHPFAVGDWDPDKFRAYVSVLERLILRGIRPDPGTVGIISALKEALNTNSEMRRDDGLAADELEDLICWFSKLASSIRQFEAIVETPLISFGDMLVAHNRLVEALAPTDKNGSCLIWNDDQGQQAAAFISELYSVSQDSSKMRGSDYLAMFESVLDGNYFRSPYVGHSRLTILGPLEGRLMQFDRVILGGMNEGSWPPEPIPDPWLSRNMRSELGLPLPEIRVGQSAHDFVQACGSKEVFITRAARVHGTPMVPSRWLLRMSAVLDGLGICGGLLKEGVNWKYWQSKLDEAQKLTRRLPPVPRPPVNHRPRSFSVSQIETWLRNPYGLYARRILNLEPLQLIDNELGVSEKGLFIHKALDEFLRSSPTGNADTDLKLLLKCGRLAFGRALKNPLIRAFWWPRFEKIADWFVSVQISRQGEIINSYSEITGKINLGGPAGNVELKATADRIDKHFDGDWSIIDYKTGAVPRKYEFLSGLAPQLPLEALILRHGGFDSLPLGTCISMDYWHLKGSEPAGKIISFTDNLELEIDRAEIGILRLIKAFDNVKTPYLAHPNPLLAPRYDEYAHLARIKEWS